MSGFSIADRATRKSGGVNWLRYMLFGFKAQMDGISGLKLINEEEKERVSSR